MTDKEMTMTDDRQPSDRAGVCVWLLITLIALATAYGTNHTTKREDCYRESARSGCTTRR